MSGPVRVLAFSGSARAGSLNRRFLAAAATALREAGCLVTVVEVRDLAIPLYDGDLEEASGLPEGVTRLLGLLGTHDAVLVASPEYNGTLTPLLKNTLDWLSRADENPFEGLVAAVISASPGPYGGVRSLQTSQQLLLKLGCHVVPGQCTLIHASAAFAEDGSLKEERAWKALRALAADLASLAGRLSA